MTLVTLNGLTCRIVAVGEIMRAGDYQEFARGWNGPLDPPEWHLMPDYNIGYVSTDSDPRVARPISTP